MNKTGEKKKTPASTIVMLVVLAAFAGAVGADRFYMPNFKTEFAALDRQRIEAANRLATAKIIHENLNHVHDLVFSNMTFPGVPDTIDHETQFFEFITESINDLKLTLMAMRPIAPVTEGRVTTFGYDVELEGDFFRFGELCAKFENNRRIVSVESFDVEQMSDRDRQQTTSAQIIPDGPSHMGIRVRMRVNTYRVRKG